MSLATLSLAHALVVVGAGLAAGFINVIVGSGSLITFPVLLAVGLSPVVANVTNNVGLVPGNVSGTIAYRRELEGQGRRFVRLAVASVVGAGCGAALLLALPGKVFERAVPFLIVIACLLMAAQPTVSRWLESRRDTERPAHGSWGLWAAVLATAIYGGYFGAAQGVILLSLLAIFITEDLQRLNGLKNALVFVANGVAAIIFIAFSHVSWEAAGLIAIGAFVGGQVGGIVGRRLPVQVLRLLVVIGGLIVAGILFAKYW